LSGGDEETRKAQDHKNIVAFLEDHSILGTAEFNKTSNPAMNQKSFTMPGSAVSSPHNIRITSEE
jgi:hypothetical protein